MIKRIDEISSLKHLIKTTNAVRQRNIELQKQVKDLETQVEFWKNKLIKTKKISRKRKKMLQRVLSYVYYKTNYKFMNDIILLDKWLQE